MTQYLIQDGQCPIATTIEESNGTVDCIAFLDQEVERILQSGVLGRSPVYGKLLRYLHECTVRGAVPHEIDIAVEVLGRTDFDSASDSSVRVYVHKLRQKLEHYYDRGAAATQARHLHIPKGEYTLQVADRVASGAGTSSPRRSRWRARAAAAAAVVLVLLACLPALTGLWSRGAGHTPLWRSLLESDRPLVVVVGDYYLFAEIDSDGVTERLIRDFRVNSREDLAAGYDDPAAPERRFADIRLSYLPLGTAPALATVLEVVHDAGKSPIIIPESQLDIQTIRSSDVIYLGYLSGLGVLSDFVFASSRFQLGPTYDELIDRETGEIYMSEAGFLYGPEADYVDYGLVSTFTGPEGSRLLIIAGMRDEGLMQMASVLSSADSVMNLMAKVPGTHEKPSLEALYRVRGMHRMNIASTLLLASTLDSDRIWIDAPAARLSLSAVPDSGGKPE